MRTSKTLCGLIAVVVAVQACSKQRVSAVPDRAPEMLNDSLPFAYPRGYYIQMIDDSVTLRLHIDKYGRPVPESTSIAVHATYAAFDTAALDGVQQLVFRPAERDSVPIPLTILLPVKFQVPRTHKDSSPPTSR